MRRVLLSAILMMAAVLGSGCGGYGGPCKYDEHPGTALITSVEEDTNDMRTCRNAARILYTFTPDDPSAYDEYRFPASRDTDQVFLVGSGCTPPLNWAISEGLIAGSEHRCVRMDEFKGTCDPVVYKFPDISFSHWGDSCISR